METTERHTCFHDWHGSAHDIGFQHGKTLSRQIVAECQPALDAAAASNGQTVDGFLLRYAFFATTRDGARLSFGKDEGCTAFHTAADTTADGHVLLGQTKDTGAPLERYHIMRRVYDDGLAVLTLNYAG